MTSLEVIVLGVGDTFSTRHVTTSFLVEAGGFLLGVDCPDRFLGVLRAAGVASGRPLTPDRVDDVLLTHVHGDHMNGLEGLAYFKHFVEGKRLRLHTPPEVRDDLWERRLVAPMGRLWDGRAFRDLRFEDYFDWHPLPFDQERAIGPLRVRARRTVHHVPTAAIRVSCEGRTLGYSADTAFDPALIDWLADGADLVIHETNFGPAHTPYAALAALPGPLRAKMRLIHYPDSFDLAGSAIAPLVEGQVLPLTSP